MLPVLAMLRAGTHGPFAAVLHAVTGPGGEPLPLAYFWFAGVLSSFLDNAPTYLVFFNMAGGDPQQLMTALAPTLAALSAGSVFMGANTYIGNAPNFMVRPSPSSAASACPRSSATWRGRASSCCRCSR
jgi:Na+/H+ antiporter NhaD/arsenite permease-like protein